jgi:hypothetical protein
MAARVVDLDRGDRAARREHAARLTEGRHRVREVLQEPHHPDVVERVVVEGERQGVGLQQGRIDARLRQVRAGEVELPLLDVDPGQLDAGKLLAEHR